MVKQLCKVCLTGCASGFSGFQSPRTFKGVADQRGDFKLLCVSGNKKEMRKPSSMWVCQRRTRHAEPVQPQLNLVTAPPSEMHQREAQDRRPAAIAQVTGEGIASLLAAQQGDVTAQFLGVMSV